MAFKEFVGQKQMHTCDCCGREFQHGPHLYQGKYVPEIDRTLCLGCAPPQWSVGSERLEELKRQFPRPKDGSKK